MEQLVVAAVLVLVAGAVAWAIQRRRPDPPTQPRTYTVPSQLDRSDFTVPDAPWLVVAFTAASCSTCQGMWQKVQVLESDDVAVQEAELAADSELHERYQIDGVPLIVIVDADGVVRASFVGPATATDLWATVAELREPGSTPEACDHGQGDHADHTSAAG